MEVVQKRKESQVDEFHEMKRINLFSVNEINKIIKKRSDLDYRIERVNKDVQDYMAYIQHEKELLKEIRYKREKMKIMEKKGDIEFRIMKRIKNIYETGIQRFPKDYNFSLSYFKFCKTLNSTGAASMAIQNILKNFSHVPDVWKLAAKFYAYDKKDKKEAIAVLLKGVTTHKEDHSLYKEAIEIELSDIHEENAPKKTDEELQKHRALVCEKIKNYLETILHDIKDFMFYIEILDLLEGYPYTIEMQNHIIDKLLELHSDEAIVWHTIAQRELNGLHYKPDQEKPVPSIKLNLERCFRRYQEGLEHLSGTQKTDLWHHYLDCLITLQGDRKNAYQLKTQTLQSAFEEVCEQDILTEKHYVVWIEILGTQLEEAENNAKREDCQEDIIAVLEKGLESIPQSVELWKLRLKAAIMTDDENEVNRVLKRSVTTLNEKAGPLWLMALRFHILVSDEEKIDEFYQSAIQQPFEVSKIFKPQYIHWLGLTRDITEIRMKYNAMAMETPHCKELHSVMDKVESNESTPDPKAWEKVHQNACNQFGKCDVDVWIAYAQFLSRYRKQDIPKIARQAQAQLPPLLYSEFQEKFAKLEEYNKISEGNPAEKFFNMLSQSVRKKARTEQENSMYD